MRGAILACLAAALLAGCNTLTTSVLNPSVRENFIAGEPQACAFEGRVHALSAAEDLGGGYVAQFREDAPGASGVEDYLIWRITYCQSGQTVVLGLYRAGTDPETSYDNRDLLGAFRARLAALAEPASLDLFSEQAEEVGLAATRAEELTETCGCAALYPEMLGSQAPSSFRDLR